MSVAKSRVVEKPWGREEVYAETDRYVGKILIIREGQSLSLQYHERKDETIRLLEGRLELELGPNGDALDLYRLAPGDVVRIRPNTVHRMRATSECRVLEVSTPELDDVVRIHDLYGREGTSAP